MIVDRVKRRLHREIVADPVAHGLVLNLYLNGEAYPHRVDDYFPIAAADDPVLADRMARHAREEDKHVALYAKAVRSLGEPVLELPLADVFNEVIRAHTPVPFRMEQSDDADARRTKLAHFLAHAHFLEKRVARSLEYHLDACAGAASPYPAKAVGLVLADEHEHVRYTREAVETLLPRARAAEVLAVHARAEARANFDFSARQMRQLLGRRAASFSRASRALYRACGALMEVALHA